MLMEQYGVMARIVFYDVSDQDKPQLEQAFRSSGHEVITVTGGITIDNTDSQAEIISVFVSSNVTNDIINKAEHLKHIACRSTGFNNIDVAAAKAKGVIVTNVPTYGSHTVAEYAFALLLTLSRKIDKAVSSAQQGVTKRIELQGFDLHEKTFGIIGAGKIGSCSAGIAKGFGMRVLAHDAFPKPEVARDIGFEYVSMEQLLAESDVISLHAPYTEENHHLLNAERITQIKKGAILLNTARGELVDNRALIGALESGYLGGAAMDVLEGEQLIDIDEELLLVRAENAPAESLRHSLEVSVLKKLPNVIITNHNAFNTREAIARINHTTTENILTYLKGQPENIVS